MNMSLFHYCIFATFSVADSDFDDRRITAFCDEALEMFG